MSAHPLRIGVVGCGAIGLELVKLLHAQNVVRIEAVVVRPQRVEACRGLLRGLGLDSRVVTDVQPGLDRLVECGGHSAIAEHVVPSLRAGVSAVIASVGALARDELLAEVRRAAVAGGAQVQVIPGAIGGIDALAAARLCGLAEVTYTGTKPPGAWLGTPAEQVVDLVGLREARVVFEGSAREASQLYPRNANVTATIAMAGIGFDDTRVKLVADPAATQNLHRLQASGGFGRMDVQLANVPLPANPKTSALTLYSALRAVLNHANVISI